MAYFDSDNGEPIKNNFAEKVELAGYTNSWYEFPDDGYVQIYCNSNGLINVSITGANETSGTSMSASRSDAAAIVQSLFVKKGMKLKVYYNTGSGTVRYHKLIP